MDLYWTRDNFTSKSVQFISMFQALGLLCVILAGIWLGSYWGGFSWDDTTMFNYHPLFMILGLVFLYGDAILVYRVFRTYRKLPIKILHGLLHILAFVFAVIGLQAVYKQNTNSGNRHLRSLHSWLGVVTVALFFVQWFAGFITFLVPKVPMRVRSSYLPVHVSFGGYLYVLIIGVCIAGINQKNSSALPPAPPRHEVVGNILGVCLALFGGLVFYLISNPEYRRVEPVPPERQTLNE